MRFETWMAFFLLAFTDMIDALQLIVDVVAGQVGIDLEHVRMHRPPHLGKIIQPVTDDARDFVADSSSPATLPRSSRTIARIALRCCMTSFKVFYISQERKCPKGDIIITASPLRERRSPARRGEERGTVAVPVPKVTRGRGVDNGSA